MFAKAISIEAANQPSDVIFKFPVISMVLGGFHGLGVWEEMVGFHATSIKGVFAEWLV